jgi:DNA-binding IclR family transcriptional regulator
MTFKPDHFAHGTLPERLPGNQEIAACTNLPNHVSRLTYRFTKLGYLTPVPRFEKYQLAPPAMWLGYAALANLGVRHLAETYRGRGHARWLERSGETVARHGFAISAGEWHGGFLLPETDG